MSKSPKKKGHTDLTHVPRAGHKPHSTGLYQSLERKLACDPTAWPPTDELILALERNSIEPIPALVVEHLRQRLDRTAKKPRGRKKISDANSLLRNHLVPIYYSRYLAWLQKRNRTQGLTGWSCIKTAPWWQGAPNERAARMVQKALKRNVDWPHVLNMVSKSRS